MTIAADGNDTHSGVVTALYLRTKTLHAEAERSGIIRDILRGQATRGGYVLFLRNLLPAYRAMEGGLDRGKKTPPLSFLSSFKFDRASAIEADLEAMCGPGWRGAVPVLQAATAYAKRIDDAAADDGSRLIAHAYARYLGDLSGGLILQKLLARSLGLTSAQLSFYAFPQYADLAALKEDYRDALERAGSAAPSKSSIVEEGAVAFQCNIDLSWAVHKAHARQAS